MVEYHVSSIAPGDVAALLRWVLQLLTQYRDSNLWQVSLQTVGSLKEERQLDQCRCGRLMLLCFCRLQGARCVALRARGFL